MSDEEFVLQKEPVYGRDESATKLLGWTWSEMIMVAASVVMTHVMFHRRLLTIGAAILMYLYIRRVKRYLPDRFFSNMWRFIWRKETVYRAAGRDLLWRAPIVHDSAPK